MRNFLYLIIYIQIMFQITACQSVENSGDKNRMVEKSSPNVVQDKPSAEKSPLPRTDNANIRKCFPAKVPRSGGLPGTADMNEVLEKDDSVDGLNKTLENLFDELTIADKIKGKNFFESDFNGDDCSDIAIVVKAVDEYPIDGEINNSLGYQMAETIVQNLEKGGVINLQRSKKEGFKPTAKDLTNSKFALAVIFGGDQGWNWKYGGEGRLYLLLDAVYTQEICPDCQTVLVNKSDKNSAYNECLPTNAVGNGLFTGGEEGGKIVYFDGKKFNQKQCGD